MGTISHQKMPTGYVFIILYFIFTDYAVLNSWFFAELSSFVQYFALFAAAACAAKLVGPFLLHYRFLKAPVLILIHVVVAMFAQQFCMKVQDLRARLFLYFQTLILHFKLQDQLFHSCMLPSKPDDTKKDSVNRYELYSKSSLWARVGSLYCMCDVLDTEIISMQQMVVKATNIFLTFGGILSAIFVTLGFLEHEIGIQFPLIFDMYLFMAVFYPALSLVLCFESLLIFALSGEAPRCLAGSNPYASTSMREFWGGRYNQCISDHCKRIIFRPLMDRLRLSPMLASFAVFFATGLLHTLPLSSLPAAEPLDLVLSQAFFLAHWAVCAIEVRARWAPSRARTWLIFLALAPLFAYPWVRNLSRPEVALPLRLPREAWDRLRQAAGRAPGPMVVQ